MSNHTWTTTSGGDWLTATDWSPNTVPNDATALAIIPGAASGYTVTIDTGESEIVNAITLGDLVVGHAEPTLQVSGKLTFAGSNPSMAFLSGALQIASGGVLDGEGVLGGEQGPGPFVVVNDGTVAADAGSTTQLAFLTGFNNLGIVLANNGNVEIEGPAGLTNLSGTALTGGTWIVQGPTSGTFNQIDIGFNFDAVIAVDAATIVLDGRASDIDGYASGSFQPIEQQLQSIAATGTLQLLDDRGYHTTGTLDDAGSLILQGGTLSTGGLTVDSTGSLDGFGVVNGPLASQGVITADNGVLNITTPVRGSGNFSTASAESALVLNGATAVSLINPGTVYDASGLLDITGTLSGNGTLVVENGATIAIASSTSQTVKFSGSDVTLNLDDFPGYAGTLVGFAQSDAIVLAGTTATSAFVSGGSLFVMDNATTIDSVALAGSYAPDASFSVSESGGNAVVTNTGGAPLQQDFPFTINLNDTVGLNSTEDDNIVNDLSAAALDWAQYLTGYTTLRIQLNIEAGSTGAELANAGPTENISTGTTLDGHQFFDPSSLIALTTGSYAQGITSDITVNLLAGNLGSIYVNPLPTPTPSGTVPSGEFDLVTLFRHELAHGFGFGGLTNSQGALGSQETLFDHYIQDTVVNGTITAADFIGPNAEAAYGTLIGTDVPTPVPLTTLNNGEGFAHVANSSSDPDAHDLMSGLGMPSGGQLDISTLDLAILKDVGAPVTADVSVLCFCAGTGVATPTGEVPVERLMPGDTVLTAKGIARRIIWVGTGQAMVTAGHRSAATPVIVRKGALAEGVPNRDLRVTKGHSLFIDGELIPVEFLVNHRSIVWDDSAREVSVHHVELATHDVLLANGAPAESYRDDGNRWLFHNTNARWNAAPQEPCAPLLVGGEQVDRIWRRLLDRAGPRCSQPLTDDPDLHLLVNGKRLDAIERHSGRRVFRLAVRPRNVRIRSRSVVPQELGIANDPRRIGVAVQRIVLAQQRSHRAIGADDARLGDGFHRFEADNRVRWTDGDAVVPADLFAGMTGARMLIVCIDGTTWYPVDDDIRHAA